MSADEGKEGAWGERRGRHRSERHRGECAASGGTAAMEGGGAVAVVCPGTLPSRSTVCLPPAWLAYRRAPLASLGVQPLKSSTDWPGMYFDIHFD